MAMYLRFLAMVATATVVMFGLTYLNTYTWSHATYSETRTYMALMMGAAMAVVMLAFMTHMLRDRRVNTGIVIGSVLLFMLTLWLVRSQTTVGDLSYMRAMIPHHSIAILTSERARITDPRVRQLADEIIASQRREVAEMKVLIDAIEERGKSSGHARKPGRNELILGPEVPAADASAVQVPEGYRVDVVMDGLTYPTSVEFDDRGTMYVAEAGYSYGDDAPPARILSVAPDGGIRVLAAGEPLVGPVNDLLWHNGSLYVSHRGRISVFDPEDGFSDIVADLPSAGDHHNNQLAVGPEGKIYFGQGTATNAGVVGLDNDEMGWLREHPSFHDIPARDLTLVGRTFATPDILGGGANQIHTSAFHPLGQQATTDTVVPGRVKASGTILRMDADGSDLEMYAWGLRNPFGVLWSPDGTLYVTENGFDARGSRQIADDKEDILVIKPGAWYGWPDYAMGLPVTDPRFRPHDQPQPQFLLAEHPPVEQPWLTFPKHAAITKLDVSRSEAFGPGHLYVAFFGHMSPMTGTAPAEHGGHQVVRIDPATKQVTPFFTKAGGHGDGHRGQQSGEQGGDDRHQAEDAGSAGGGHGHHAQSNESTSAGPRRLLDVRFSPDGDAMYIVDFGALVMDDKPRPVPGTGVIWRVAPEGSAPAGPPANLSAPE